jgi:polyribonucleotide nucleotidyltransferase
MIPTTHTRELTLGSRTISIETGKLAKQADGAVIVRSGDTMVLVTACHAANARVGIDFLPLTVDYLGTDPGRLLQARGQTG